MLKILLKMRLQSLLFTAFNASKKKTRSRIGSVGFAVLMIYCLGCFYFLFYTSFASMAAPLQSAGIGWLYFAYVGLMDFAICLIMILFMVQKQLYDAKDNELLLSMPIKPRDILASRMALLLSVCYLYQLLILPPAFFAWWQTGAFNALTIIFFCIAFLLLPFLTLVFACLLGWIIQLISSRMSSKKSFATTAISLVFLLLYFYVVFNMQSYINTLIENGAQIASAIRSAIPPFYYLGTALEQGDILSLLLFVAWTLIPFAAVYFLLAKSFSSLALYKKSGPRIKYEAKAMKVQSPFKALISKELHHFTSSSTYMLNAGLGIIFLIGGGIFALIKQGDIQDMFWQISGGGNEWGIAIAGMILCLFISMNIVSAPSISLEGKSLWLAQSLPLKNGEPLFAKAATHILLVLPAALFACLCVCIAMQTNLTYTVLLFFCTISFTVFTAFLGLIINLYFPKFDWTNEAAVIKRSMSTNVSMLAAMALSLLPFILYFSVLGAFLPLYLFLLIFAVLFAIINAIFIFYCKNGGGEKFNRLF